MGKYSFPVVDYDTGWTYKWDQDFIPTPEEREKFIQAERAKKSQNVGLLDHLSSLAFKPIEPIKKGAELYAKAREALPTLTGFAERAYPPLGAIAGLAETSARIGAATAPDLSLRQRAQHALGPTKPVVEGTSAGIKESGKILTPLDVALLATGAGGGLPGTIGKVLSGMSRGLSAADILAGGVQMAGGGTPLEIGMGAARTAGAAAGMRPHPPTPEPEFHKVPVDEVLNPQEAAHAQMDARLESGDVLDPVEAWDYGKATDTIGTHEWNDDLPDLMGGYSAEELAVIAKQRPEFAETYPQYFNVPESEALGNVTDIEFNPVEDRPGRLIGDVTEEVPQPVEEPELVTVYSGGEGQGFFTTDPKRAASYGSVRSVDVPREVYEAGKSEARRLGEPTPQDSVLPNEYVNQAKPVDVQPDVTEITDTGQTLEDLMAEFSRGEEVPTTPPPQQQPRIVGNEPNIENVRAFIENNPENANTTQIQRRFRIGFNLASKLLDEAKTTRSSEPTITPSRSLPVEGVHLPEFDESFDAPPAGAPERNVAPMNANLEAPAPSEPAAEPIVSEPALEAQAPPKNFTAYLTQKFGDKQPSKKERILARKEWEQVKDDRAVERLAKKMGVPPDKVKEVLKGAPSEGNEGAQNLSTLRRIALPVIDNLKKVHPVLGDLFDRYVTMAEKPAMGKIADSYRIKRNLSHSESREVIDILSGKKAITAASNTKVSSAARNYRAMLDQTLLDAKNSGVLSRNDYNEIKSTYGQGDSGTYFPKKFAEGWDDNLLRFPELDKTWNLRDPHLEMRRTTNRGDWRRDLGVLDEYFLSAYRRMSETKVFGKRLEVLRKLMNQMPLNKPTSDWLHTNIRRVLGREAPGSFDKVSGNIRHAQALSDLALSGFYQPAQAANTAMYAGFGRSARAVAHLARNYPNEVYDAIRSGALAPTITQEVIQGAHTAAATGIQSPMLGQFMWGVPTIDKWTRVHANTAGKLLVQDALKGSKGALRDLKTLGFETLENTPDFSEKVGKAVADKALYRTGTLELPGWASSPAGKLATQYTRFMYRHTHFVSELFSKAAKGDVVPLARSLAALGTIIPGAAEVLYPIREALREGVKQTVSEGPYDPTKMRQAALGDEANFDEEIQWKHALQNKRIPWSHPLKRMLQNTAIWGGAGIFQVMLERASRGGSAFEVGGKTLAGPVPTTVMEGLGSFEKDIQSMFGDEPSGKYTGRFGLQQLPLVGYPLSKRVFPPVESAPTGRRKRRTRS